MVELDRRGALALGGLGALASAPVWARGMVDLGRSEANGRRPLAHGFPGKRGMILHRTRALQK